MIVNKGHESKVLKSTVYLDLNYYTLKLIALVKPARSHIICEGYSAARKSSKRRTGDSGVEVRERTISYNRYSFFIKQMPYQSNYLLCNQRADDNI